MKKASAPWQREAFFVFPWPPKCFGAEAAEVNFRPVRKDQASGIRFGATRPDAHKARYFLLVVFFFFLAAFFFAITQSPPFLENKCTLLKISRQRFFTKSSGKIIAGFFERAL
jgi:hypothetical protein